MTLQLLPRTSQSCRQLASASLYPQVRGVVMQVHSPSSPSRSPTLHYSTRPPTPANPTPSPPKPNTLHENPPLPSFNLFHAVQDSRPAVRYTVYAGLGLMATVESTFWYKVFKAKFFPATSEEENAKADEFMENVREAIAGYRVAWMGNYWKYYGGYVWGVGER